jgi:DNA polymerase-3 subunit delta
MKNVFLFYGNEELMIKNKIDKLVNSITDNQYNINVYDMQINNVSMAVQDLLTPPFLSDNKVVIIKNPIFLTKLKSEIEHKTEMLLNYLDNIEETSYLIIDASGLKIEENNSLYKKLKQKGEVSETKELSQVEMKGWLKRKFAIIGKEITDEAVLLFFERIGWNLLTANNEFDKVANYVGSKETITLSDIEKVVVKELETDVFKLTNALQEGDRKQVILLYQDLVKTGNDPVKLLGLVSKTVKDTYNVCLMLEKGYKQIDIANYCGVSKQSVSMSV